MAKGVEYIISEGAATIDAVANNKPALTLKGWKQEKEDALNNALEEAKKKNAAQIKAAKNTGEKTENQQKVFDSVLGFISRAQKAAKSAYRDQTAILKKFRVGDKQPASVKALISWAEYFTGLILEYDDVLLENGLVQEDLTAFAGNYNLLLAAGPAQDSAERLQEAATLARDKAAAKLNDEIQKTRNFVKAAFSDNKEVLVQFKPGSKGRGSSGNNEAESSENATAPVNTQNPAA